eukprot:4947788-Alexandrium_andersonii.AAC.1
MATDVYVYVYVYERVCACVRVCVSGCGCGCGPFRARLGAAPQSCIPLVRPPDPARTDRRGTRAGAEQRGCATAFG